MSEIWFNFKQRSHVTRERDPEDEWSGQDTATDWTPPTKGYLTKPEDWGFESEPVGEDTKPGDTVFVTYVIYSTGDSFSRHDRGGCEVIGFYKSMEDAYKARDAVYKYKDDNSVKWDDLMKNTVMVPTFDGTNERPQYCGSWTGYFECIDEVSVDSVTVHP